MACDQEPLQRRGRHAVQDPTDSLPAAHVPALRPRAPLGDVEQVDAERLGDPLPIPAPEVGGHADHPRGTVDPPELRGPPPVRRPLEAILVVAGRLARPRLSVGGVGSGLEHRVRRVVEHLAGGTHGRDRGRPVGHVPARVQRERDLVDDTPHDGEREARSGLPFPPVIPDYPAADARFRGDAAVGDGRYERLTGGPVRGRNERARCRGAGPEVRLQCR